MNLTMVPVTADNREEISRLHVAAGQESYIETVPQCLREAEEEARWRPFGIFDGKQAVGFAMLGFFEKEYPVAFFTEGRIHASYISAAAGTFVAGPLFD